jgi:hypothetical protein
MKNLLVSNFQEQEPEVHYAHVIGDAKPVASEKFSRKSGARPGSIWSQLRLNLLENKELAPGACFF